jgi:hypothetical protein
MIRPAKMSFDLIDNVVESGILDSEPFPVLYRPTIQSPPDFSNVSKEGDPKLFTAEFEHVSTAQVKACSLAMANFVATSAFAKSIVNRTLISDSAEIVGM